MLPPRTSTCQHYCETEHSRGDCPHFTFGHCGEAVLWGDSAAHLSRHRHPRVRGPAQLRGANGARPTPRDQHYRSLDLPGYYGYQVRIAGGVGVVTPSKWFFPTIRAGPLSKRRTLTQFSCAGQSGRSGTWGRPGGRRGLGLRNRLLHEDRSSRNLGELADALHLGSVHDRPRLPGLLLGRLVPADQAGRGRHCPVLRASIRR